MILVTTSTGHLGRHVVNALPGHVPASQIVAGARHSSKASVLAAKGVAVRELDYARLETLAPALLAEPTTGNFGRQFLFADPDGYAIVAHDGK